MAELEIDSLSLRFGGLQVLDRVSLRVERGELFALIGPNGAGKTSVLNCISGIYRGEGAIRFQGQTISGRAPREIARLGVARTFQHGELFADMTVVENLLTGRHSPHPHQSARRDAVSAGRAARRGASARSGRGDHRIRRVGALPPRARSALAVRHPEDRRLRARAALEPAVLLLDEPSAGLNREEREDLARFILRIKHELGIAMIWIEHDMQMVADLADRIHVLDHGQSLTEGAPGDVLRHPAVIDAYLGSSARAG